MRAFLSEQGMSRSQEMTPAIYKILRADEWAGFQSEGVFVGSPDDLRDGFIHLSFDDQVSGSAARHFSGETDLVIVCLDQKKLGSALRLELSRGGQKFPHLYRAMRREDVMEVKSWQDFSCRSQ